MRLGTKILLLTLAIALGLAGGIGYFVTRDVRRHEQERAREEIRGAVSAYFDRIAEQHRTADSVVRLLIEEPVSRSFLPTLEEGKADSAPLETARVQIGQEVFGSHVQRELTGPQGAPAFHVLLNGEGRVLLVEVPGKDGGALRKALEGGAVRWQCEAVLASPTPSVRQYVRHGTKLYLAMGVRLRQNLSEDASHVYFIGYAVDDTWTRVLVPASHGAISVQAMFLLDGQVVGRATSDVPGGSAVLGGLERSARSAVQRLDAAGKQEDRREIEFDAAGERFVGEAIVFTPAPGARGALAVASSLTRALADLRDLQKTIVLVTACALLLAVVAFQVVSQYIARPVRQLVDGTQRVARGEFDQPVRLKRPRRDELGELASSFNAMAQGLKQRDLIKNLFGKVLDPRIVERYVADPAEAKPGGERRVQSVLFSDLEGFTTVAERLPAQDLVRLLNGYLDDAERTIAAEDGLLDKFVADGVIAFWGPPFHDRHAARACRAALKMSEAAARQADACQALGVPPLAVRVGVATGEVVVGNVGSANHFGYTVLGDVANLGSRLEGLNKLYRTRVLVDARTAKEAADVVLTRRVDRVRVVGRNEPVELFEVMAVRGDAASVPAAERLRDSYEAALALYDARDFDRARQAFDALAEAGDATSQLMAARCVIVAEWHRAGEWEGVWTAETK